MAFLIRTIDTTASGREIVRDRELAKDAIAIGRASESDIHLPDLAIEQNHARITSSHGGALKVESVGGLGFTVNGRKTQSTTINPREGAELGFATYRIAVSQDGDAPVLLTVSQTADPQADSDATSGFALSSALPGKRPMAWATLAAILIAFLAIPIWTHLTREKVEPSIQKPGQVVMDASWSTGKLSLAHHGLEDNCEACHTTPFVSVRDETCLTCHEDIGDHAPIPRQLTGRGPMSTGDEILWAVADQFGKEGPGSCTTCHNEHEGAGPMEPTRQQFCADCHDGMDTRLPDTDLANAADFGDAHPQFKALITTAPGQAKPMRVSLDGNPQEYNGLKFPHDIHMEARGGVARMAESLGAANGYGEQLICSDCHRLTADKASFLPVDMEEGCESCHSLVYDKVGSTFRTLRHGDVAQMQADLIAMDRAPRSAVVPRRSRPGTSNLIRPSFGRTPGRYVAISNALSPKGVCGECHIPTTVSGKPDVMPVNLRESYLVHSWFDHEDHKQEECSSCHAAETSGAATDLLLPGIAQCRTCHLGEKATQAAVPSSCAMCHSYHPSTPAGLPAGDKEDIIAEIARFGRKTG